MNFPERVKNDPIYQSFFAVGSLALLLLSTTLIRYYAVVERFNSAVEPGAVSVINRYTVVEVALLLISLAAVCFIWFVLLQGRLAGRIAFNFQSPLDASKYQHRVEEVMPDSDETILEQNRFLTQSMQVGRELLNTDGLQELLTKAVDDVQEKFDLYHAQIYLAENSGRTLTLKAGSGRIGSELVRRGHRLSIGSGSINGTAAQRRETVLVSDTSNSELFLSNPLLMQTKSEMSIPLIASNQLLGVLNLQSINISGLSQSFSKAVEGLASQLAVAIAHANRIAELEEAQQTVMEQAARLTRVGWRDWLEFLDNNEELSYFHQPIGENKPSLTSDNQNMFMASSIVVSGAEVGNIHIETDSNRHWGMEDIDLVRAVADQLGQKIENLRLLNESDRYREEAEVALRQLTRENWGEFTDSLEVGGYLFDGASIDPINPLNSFFEKSGEQLDLTIQGETVGSISIPESIVEPDRKEMVESIATSLSGHLENLRLTEQTQRQVFELSLLNRINSAMTAQLDFYDLVDVVGAELRRGFNASGTFVSTYNKETNMMEYPFFVLDNAKDGVRRIKEEPRTRGTGFSSQVIQSGEPLLISRNPAEMIRAGALVVDYGDMPHSYLGVPIIFGDEVLGVLSLQNGPDRKLFNENDQELVISIANTMALALQNSTLFVETQSALDVSEQRRQELQVINAVVADTTSAVTLEEAIDRMAQKLTEVIEGEQVCATLLGNTDDELIIVCERNATGSLHANVGSSLNLQEFPDQKAALNNQRLQKSESNIDHEGRPRQITLPLIGQSGAIGTVLLDQAKDQPGFTDAQINLAETIVFQVSTVLENKQLLNETRNRALREQKVRTITDRIRRGADQKEILRIAQEELSNLIGAKKARSWMGSSKKLAQLDKTKPQPEGN